MLIRTTSRFIVLLRLFSETVVAQPAPSHFSGVLFRSDTECSLLVDGRVNGTLSPRAALQITLARGEHRIEAVVSRGAGKWEKTIEVTTKPLEVAISFGAVLGHWIDPSTKLMWTSADSGSGLSWSQAIRYCRELESSGYKDWLLPSIDDLEGIFERAPSETGYHVRGPIKLSGWQWSGTPGSQEGEGWTLDFGDGGRASVPAGDSGLNRALCVRHVKE